MHYDLQNVGPPYLHPNVSRKYEVLLSFCIEIKQSKNSQMLQDTLIHDETAFNK